LVEVPFLGYEVENLADGRKIIITKPGGKISRGGQMLVHDFQVWIYNEDTGERWRISHGEIKEDIRMKLEADKTKGKLVIEALKKVHEGVEPETLKSYDKLVESLPGFSLELILKAYKWIFGQEDCNYPPPRFQGRDMAMEGILELLSDID
jgi:hypothetical protein